MAGTLLLLRPPAQAARLQAALASLGVASEPFCVLDTVADADGLAALPALARVSHWLVFVSPSAIDIAWPVLADKLPPGVKLAAVGRGSGQKLQAVSGRGVLYPDDGNDSDALLALAPMQQVAGQRILIVRGHDGRAQLGETLAARGALPRHADVYRREPRQPDWARLIALLRSGGLAGLVVTSSDIADALFAQASPEQATLLRSLPFFTLHPRIALRLRQHGVANLSLCDGSAGALAAMLSN
ncbi:uroporphyrinogen-III synthase [Vogesella urethralis]|uniref:uroporphyrinogen-III synthase n=1 Tax=Vogesella urethralis TaxID=2592656 RepID=UPI001184EB97|nr:uroporphyrinogen-III synthase [Vogesella urethralis]